jgi:hypothetical protein
MGLGIGLAASNTPAVLSGLLRRGGTFVRTPKYALAGRRDEWGEKRYRIRGGASTTAEGLLSLYFLAAIAFCLAEGLWASVPFLYLFLQGNAYMFLLSLAPALRRARRKRPLSSRGLAWTAVEPEHPTAAGSGSPAPGSPLP